MTRFHSLLATALALLLTGCSKDPNAPDAMTSLSGHWITADTVDVFTGFNVNMVQADNGLLSGAWTGTTLITNGKCDSTYGCAPGNTISGSNLSLRIDMEILGAGTYTAQLVSKDQMDGKIVRFQKSYRLRLHRVN